MADVKQARTAYGNRARIRVAAVVAILGAGAAVGGYVVLRGDRVVETNARAAPDAERYRWHTRVSRQVNAARNSLDAGDLNAARAGFRAALDDVPVARAKSREAALLRRELADVFTRQGEHERAIALLEVARDVYATLGDAGRLSLGVTLIELAAAQIESADPANALRAAMSAVDVIAAARGDTGREASRARIVAGRAARAAADPTARQLLRRAAKDLTASDDDPLALAGAFEAMAELASDETDWPLAIAHLENATELRERTLGGDDVRVARSLQRLGDTLRTSGDCAKADDILERALEMTEDALGDDHLWVADALHSLGRCAETRRDWVTAVALLKRCLAIRQAKGTPPQLIASTKFDLARPMWQVDEERPRATALAAQARRALSNAGTDADPYVLDRLDRWMSSHVTR
jgi:tetratricopeptide (TPR) repeat protein